MSILLLDRLVEYISADKKEKRLYKGAILFALSLFLIAAILGLLLQGF